MKRVFAIILAMSLGACATVTHTATGLAHNHIVQGAAVGAGSGAAIGAVAGPVSVAVGAGVGAAAGATAAAFGERHTEQLQNSGN